MGTINKNARAVDKKEIANSLSRASAVTDSWRWIDFVDPALNVPCLLLEYLFGTRGSLCGRMLKIEAMEGVGKSSYCFLQYAMAQAHGGFCWHGESEHAPPPPDYIASFGCDPENLLIQHPGSIERGFYAMEEVIKAIRADDGPDPTPMHKVNGKLVPSGEPHKYPIVVGLDSISGFGADAMIDADDVPDPGLVGGLGAHARVVSKWFRDRGSVLDKKDVFMITTAQQKATINTGFGAQFANKDDTTIAARPLNFHASWRVKMRTRALKDKKTNEDVGEYLVMKTVKNKLSPKGREVELHHYRDFGYDLTTPTHDWLKAQTPWILPDGSSFDITANGAYTRCERLAGASNFQGEEGKQELMLLLYEDKELLALCREHLRIRGFGFDFEKQYTPTQSEIEDIQDDIAIEAMKADGMSEEEAIEAAEKQADV